MVGTSNKSDPVAWPLIWQMLSPGCGYRWKNPQSWEDFQYPGEFKIHNTTGFSNHGLGLIPSHEVSIGFLVGGIPTPLKNMSKSQLGWWHSQHMEKWNSCSKPPTRFNWLIGFQMDQFIIANKPGRIELPRTNQGYVLIYWPINRVFLMVHFWVMGKDPIKTVTHMLTL